jgi:hypothetical protein
MPEDLSPILDRIQKFQETFEQIYHRKMTDEELRVLRAAREIIERTLRKQGSEPATD